MANELAPIIVKRKKVIAGSHHGGAWKVAYADFVTAMMAFFLMMWLLGATTEKQRKGIADYFNPTIPVNKVSGGGSGAFGGDSIFSENSLAENGAGAGLSLPDRSLEDSEQQEVELSSQQGQDPLEEIADRLVGKTGESLLSEILKKHVVTRVTDEGLIVELFDIPGSPLFEPSGEPTPVLVALIASVAEVFAAPPNEIAVQGHVASVPLAARSNPVWELSASWADRVRTLFDETDVHPERIQRVTGFADRKPASNDRLSIRNNRVEIILLRDLP